MLEDELLKVISDKIGRKYQETDEIKDNQICYSKNSENKVVKLSLNNCNLMNETIPEEIWKLENLEEVNMSNNMISYFPEGILKLKKLKKLMINGNQIRIITGKIKYNQNLREIDFASNQLETLPSEIGNLNKLKKLRLNTNRLMLLPLIDPETQWLSLESLDLDGADIKELPKWLFKLKSLKYLSLSKLHLNRFPEEVCLMNKLEGLYLDSTKFPKWPNEIRLPSTIHYIVLDGAYLPVDKNNIKKLPVGIINLKPRYVPNQKSICLSDSAFQVSLGGNIINGLNKELVFNEDINISYNYLIDLYKEESEDEEQVRIKDIKISLLGYGGAGKSSLVQRLCQNDPDNDNIPLESLQTTHGVNVDYFMNLHNVWDGAKQCYVDVMAHFWDFGGQDKYIGINRLLLTDKAIYIIVLDARTQIVPDIWLEMINSYASNSKVIMVINKLDENTRVNIDFEYYCKKYPQIYNCLFKISCKFHGKGYNKIREIAEAIKRIVNEKIDYMMPLVKKEWINVNSDIDNEYRIKNKEILSQKDYINICINNRVDSEEEQYKLLDVLNNSGKYIAIEDEWYLILNPNWLGDSLYLFYQKIDNAKPIMDYKKEYLPLLNKIERYAGYERIITDFLESRSVCLVFLEKINNKNIKKIFIPMFLKDKKISIYIPSDDPNFQFIWKSSYMPEYEFHRLLIQEFFDIIDNNYYVWQFGIYCNQKEIKIYIQLINNGIILKIWTSNNKLCGEIFKRIRYSILQSATRNFFREYIYIGNEEKNAILPYNTLCKLVEYGVELYYLPEYNCGGDLVSINVDEISEKCGFVVKGNKNANNESAFIKKQLEEGIIKMQVNIQTVNGNVNNFETNITQKKEKIEDNGNLNDEIKKLKEQIEQIGTGYENLKIIIEQLERGENKESTKKNLQNWISQTANVLTVGDILFKNKEIIIEGVKRIISLLP